MKNEWYYANGLVMDPIEDPFYNTDSEERYLKNLRDNYDEMKRCGWIAVEDDDDRDYVGEKYLFNPDKPTINDWVNLSYKMNSHGFRIDEEMPTEKKPRSIITLGCSCTLGVGMPVGQIWPTLLGNTLKVKAYNLGVAFGSLDQAFRLLLTWLPKIRSKDVFLLEPPGVRYEIALSTGFKSEGISNRMMIHRYEYEDEWILHREKTLRAIRTVCDQFDANLYVLDTNIWGDMGDVFDMKDVTNARDLEHPGRQHHIYAAMEFLKLMGYEWDNGIRV